MRCPWSNNKRATGWPERGNDADVCGDHSEVKRSIQCVLEERTWSGWLICTINSNVESLLYKG